jgi:hypothetical protein
MRKSLYDSSIWKTAPTKLAILIPCRDTVYSLFTSCLVEMIKTCTMAGIDTHVLYDASTILLNQRENLAKEAIKINSDYMLWLDSDMLFPSTTAMRMIAHNKSVVAVNYMKRSIPLNSVAYETRDNWDEWLPLVSEENLVPVEGVGMGCMLIKTKILEEIERPFFSFEYKDESWHGEDFYFQEKLRNVGHEILIDMNLSRQIRHIGQWAFGPSLGTNEEQIVKRRKKTIKGSGGE